MTEKEFIRIESRFKKEELPEELVNIVKLKIGFKRAFVLGLIKYMEKLLEDKPEDCKKRELEKAIHYLKSNFGFL